MKYHLKHRVHGNASCEPKKNNDHVVPRAVFALKAEKEKCKWCARQFEHGHGA